MKSWWSVKSKWNWWTLSFRFHRSGPVQPSRQQLACIVPATLASPQRQPRQAVHKVCFVNPDGGCRLARLAPPGQIESRHKYSYEEWGKSAKSSATHLQRQHVCIRCNAQPAKSLQLLLDYSLKPTHIPQFLCIQQIHQLPTYMLHYKAIQSRQIW